MCVGCLASGWCLVRCKTGIRMVHVTLLRGMLRCKAGNRMVHASLQGITRYAVGRAAGLGIQAIRSVTTALLETRRDSESQLGPIGLMHSPRHAPFFTTDSRREITGDTGDKSSERTRKRLFRTMQRTAAHRGPVTGRDCRDFPMVPVTT